MNQNFLYIEVESDNSPLEKQWDVFIDKHQPRVGAIAWNAKHKRFGFYTDQLNVFIGPAALLELSKFAYSKDQEVKKLYDSKKIDANGLKK